MESIRKPSKFLAVIALAITVLLVSSNVSVAAQQKITSVLLGGDCQRHYYIDGWYWMVQDLGDDCTVDIETNKPSTKRLAKLQVFDLGTYTWSTISKGKTRNGGLRFSVDPLKVNGNGSYPNGFRDFRVILDKTGKNKQQVSDTFQIRFTSL